MYNTCSPTAQMYLPLRCLSMATRCNLGGCVVTTVPWMLWSIKHYYYIYKFFLYGISERRYSQRKSHSGFVLQSVHRVDPVSFVWRIKVPFISENRKVRPCDSLFSISLTQTDYFRKVIWKPLTKIHLKNYKSIYYAFEALPKDVISLLPTIYSYITTKTHQKYISYNFPCILLVVARKANAHQAGGHWYMIPIEARNI